MVPTFCEIKETVKIHQSIDWCKYSVIYITIYILEDARTNDY